MLFTLGSAAFSLNTLGTVAPFTPRDAFSSIFISGNSCFLPSKVANLKREFQVGSPSSSDDDPGFSGTVKSYILSSAACVR